MFTRSSFVASVDRLMEAELETFFATVPYAKHLTDPEDGLDAAYYVRHRIETIHRIRGTSRTDALALASLVRESYEASRPWARYIAEELNHDRLFLRDLARHSIDEETVLATPMFPATRELLGYLESAIAESGALPAIAYSLFVEWNSDRASRAVVAATETSFSKDHAKGARAHTELDDREDHYGMMVDTILHLVPSRASEKVLHDELRIIADLLRRYFVELYEATVGARLAAMGNPS